jgi:hypothetical protein
LPGLIIAGGSRAGQSKESPPPEVARIMNPDIHRPAITPIDQS